MKYFFFLAGGSLIAWALYNIKQANSKSIREYERHAGELKEIAGELQIFAATIIADMETEAAKLRDLLAEARRNRAEAAAPLDLPAVGTKETGEVKVTYPEPIPLAEHVVKKRNRQAGKRGKNTPTSGNKYQRVLELATTGWSEGEIAKETGIGKGEVQLILQLRK